MLRRRHPAADERDVALARELGPRREVAARAERELTDAEAAGAGPEQTAVQRRGLEHALTAAYEAADAGYRVALGPVDGLKRTRYLSRLNRPAVIEADRERRELALARTHYRFAARDDLDQVPPAFVPPSVGTHATTLATHADH